MSEINYNNLPEKVGELWEDVKTIKELLKKRESEVSISQKLTFSKALVFLERQGYVMSKSKLYKLTALNKIPCKKFGNRLIFDSDELISFCENQIRNSVIDGIETVVRSAQRQLPNNL